DDGDLQVLGPPVSYSVSLEPTQRRWLFALDMPVAAPAQAVRGADMTLVSRTSVDKLRRYTVTSTTHYRLDQTLDATHRFLALRLPQGFDPRTRELSQQWRNRYHSDDAVIQAALAMFHKDFFYTLNAPLLGRDSVDDFLFDTRRGFCEHFASAFTFLMRAAGIPARVVTGYQGGYYNTTGGYLVVRQSDAHAWSEVWLGGRGWVRVDPTAAVSPQRVEFGARAAAGASAPWYQANWLQAMRNQFDVVNRFWNNAIVQFDALRQRSLLTPFGIERADYSLLVGILIGSSTLLLALFAWWVLRTPRERRDRLDAAYARLCTKLARIGAVRAANEGPQAFSQRLLQMRVTDPCVKRLMESYVELRYAQPSASTAAVQAFAQAVRRLNVKATQHAPR
ncbi:MAG TPA: transglutaminaseTgpA domain-containing protein, partial [Rudaea sp.]|nr:transglutaminaseTgpA domain-containing protein [Rudaea sp.]